MDLYKTIKRSFVGLAMVLPFSASASSVTFDLSYEFGGGTLPGGTPPWVIATFDDGGSPGTVTLNLTTPGLSGNEYLQGFAFNVDPTLNPVSISLSNQDTTDVGAAPNYVSRSAGISGISLGPSGPLFNTILWFAENDFAPNEGYSVDLNYPGITAMSFDFPDNFSSGLPVGASITRSGPGFEFGLITVVPIPTALPLFASALGLMGLAGWKRKKRTSLT